MASLKTFGGVELLEQARTDEYLRLTIDGSYVDAESSAFDDMFPTIDPCVISGRNYLDHGEACRREFSHKVAGDTLILSAMCEAVNAVFEKEITATDKGIEIKYTIKNLNTEPLPISGRDI